MLLNRPTSVALKANSSRIIAMTGGTARMVSRSALPASQRRAIAVHISRRARWLFSGMAGCSHEEIKRGKVWSGASFGEEPGHQQRRDQQSGRRILVTEPVGFVGDVHRAEAAPAITDRDVHDRSDAQ